MVPIAGLSTGAKMKSKRNVEGTLFVLMILFASLWLLWVLETEQPEPWQARQYCEMVQLYKDSNGENGWPDYRSTFANQCTNQEQ